MNITPPNQTPSRAAKAAACCACKHQRRRCTPDCLLAPYFPPENARDFENVHKLYGVGNFVKLLTEVQEQNRPDCVKSLVYEANAWKIFPDRGCCGIILEMQRQLLRYSEELDVVNKYVAMFNHQEAVNVNEWNLEAMFNQEYSVNYQPFECDDEMFYKNLNFGGGEGSSGSSSNQLCNYNFYVDEKIDEIL